MHAIEDRRQTGMACPDMWDFCLYVAGQSPNRWLLIRTLNNFARSTRTRSAGLR